MILGLYQADAAGESISLEKIENTIATLQDTPDLGTIELVLDTGNVIGYAILINYWSNEYGGFIKFIDEIFIEKAYRSKGIGTQFLHFLMHKKYQSAVAFALEVMPNNDRALRLYQQLGFVLDGRHHLFYQR